MSHPFRVAVLGGGIAGVSAATSLAESGAAVTLFEKHAQLGGRARSFPLELSDGSTVQMERGFHAFFRQYHNLRDLLRRAGVEKNLVPVEDYPILTAEGGRASFRGLPTRTPFNLIEVVRRTQSLSLDALRKVNIPAALEMLRYSPQRTYELFDDVSAAEYLRSLNFPPEAKALLFDVFAHSFFNPEEDMSAAELLMMFHFYFTGNPEGLLFDVAKQPFDRAIWRPMEAYLERLGVRVCLESPQARFEVLEGGGFSMTPGLSESGRQAFDDLVLALDCGTLSRLSAVSLRSEGAEGVLRAQLAELEPTLPFVVWRLWLDRPALPGRLPFVGTAGAGLLDNISLYELFQDESRDWAKRHGGSVVELHAYAVPAELSEAEIREELLGSLHAMRPETQEARVVDESWQYEQDCPSFVVGSAKGRPRPTTPVRGLVLAGDFVRLDTPCALMERAALSGTLAANVLLARHGCAPRPVYSIPPTGALAGGRALIRSLISSRAPRGPAPP